MSERLGWRDSDSYFILSKRSSLLQREGRETLQLKFLRKKIASHEEKEESESEPSSSFIKRLFESTKSPSHKSYFLYAAHATIKLGKCFTRLSNLTRHEVGSVYINISIWTSLGADESDTEKMFVIPITIWHYQQCQIGAISLLKFTFRQEKCLLENGNWWCRAHDQSIQYHIAKLHSHLLQIPNRLKLLCCQ